VTPSDRKAAELPQGLQGIEMNAFLFIAFPYLALVLAIGVAIYRNRRSPYTYSSLSSQLLENRKLFWGSIPWHYGITLILLAHLLVALFPGPAGLLLGGRYRMLVLELTGMGLAIFALFGLLVLILRRLPTRRLPRHTTSYMDGIVLGFLLLQVGTGMTIAIFDRWGSLWYLRTAVPWFWSLVKLHPDFSTIVRLPGLVKLHFMFGFAVILLFPFSRLVHIVMLPLQYLWRPYQVVIWNRRDNHQPSGETLR
jgi:nitrate reductase gamma subunit